MNPLTGDSFWKRLRYHSCWLRFAGKIKGNLNSAGRTIFHFDRTVMQFDDLLCHTQTKPPYLTGWFRREERIKNTTELIRWDTVAIVFDIHLDRLFTRMNRLLRPLKKTRSGIFSSSASTRCRSARKRRIQTLSLDRVSDCMSQQVTADLPFHEIVLCPGT